MHHTNRYISLTCALFLMCIYAFAGSSKSKPWVTLESRPNDITAGLSGRHLSVWPSHGRYYNNKDMWEWQRSQLYCTTEDLFTQSIVIPYLVPMLENAGAIVYVPRERDWQTNEVIVDNDSFASGYDEEHDNCPWQIAPYIGYGISKRPYHDGDRPFAKGTARMVISTTLQPSAIAYYRPSLSVSGRHAVYVSYQTVEGSTDDAQYIVVHKGQRTYFRVNQRMGSSTWVYLGTFDFAAGDKENNYVMVTNNSRHRGAIITTDAVRFGGGMGDHERGGMTSGLPRAMECSRYWVQYAGAPRAVVCSKGGTSDYGDDINCRSLMTNWLSYGSETNPTINHGKVASRDYETMTYAESVAQAYHDSLMALSPDSIQAHKIDSMTQVIADSIARIPFQHINVLSGDVMTGHVPIELQLGVHSDAGWSHDFSSIVGTLGICTSDFNDKKLASGQTRKHSFELACDLVGGITRDLRRTYGKWTGREIYDRNYSETRLPAQTSAILETMSHENFPDIRMGHDPNFKFTLARSVYKVLLKHLTRNSGNKFVVQPLPPISFRASRMNGNALTIQWEAQPDSLERTAMPDSYNIYIATDSGDYDNGMNITGNEYTLPLDANRLYRFRVTAVNKGGESFPTEELVALYNPNSSKRALIVNGFHRLSSPTVISNDTIQGFDLDDDIGLSYGKTPVWCGHQRNFTKAEAGGTYGCGYSTQDLLGRFFAGNDFNYAYTHADAIRQVMDCNIISMSSDSVTLANGFPEADIVDVLLGNERNDGHSLVPYKTFTPTLRRAVDEYADKGGKLIISGSYIASDMQAEPEKTWLCDRLGVTLAGINRIADPFSKTLTGDTICASGTNIPVYRHINETHYASVASDIIVSSDDTTQQPFPITFTDGSSAAILAERGSSKVFCMGVPFECIKAADNRKFLMSRIIDVLTQ